MALTGARQELEALCTGRPMGADARASLDRLLAAGGDDEIGEVLVHLRALDRWHFPYCPKLTDDELDRAHALIDEYVDGHVRGAEDHRRRLREAAGRLAALVRDHQLTIADAEARLDLLAKKVDVDFPIPRPLVPWADARNLIREVVAEVLA